MDKCTELAKTQLSEMNKMLSDQIDGIMIDGKLEKGMNFTGAIVDGKIKDVKSSKGEYTRHPEGLSVVYTGEAHNPHANATSRDVIELASKDRPSICRFENAFGKYIYIDCFNLDSTAGAFIREDIRSIENDTRNLIKEANKTHGDRNKWHPWEKLLLRELVQEKSRMHYVLSTDTNPEGHKYAGQGKYTEHHEGSEAWKEHGAGSWEFPGTLANMVTESCHAWTPIEKPKRSK